MIIPKLTKSHSKSTIYCVNCFQIHKTRAECGERGRFQTLSDTSINVYTLSKCQLCCGRNSQFVYSLFFQFSQLKVGKRTSSSHLKHTLRGLCEQHVGVAKPLAVWSLVFKCQKAITIEVLWRLRDQTKLDLKELWNTPLSLHYSRSPPCFPSLMTTGLYQGLPSLILL